jgi:lipopolysaccharide transport system permease protein
MAFFASFGVGLWLTALNVKYRDFKHVVPFLSSNRACIYLRLVLLLIKASTIIPEKFRMLYYLIRWPE